VLGLDKKNALEDAIGFHACWFEARQLIFVPIACLLDVYPLTTRPPPTILHVVITTLKVDRPGMERFVIGMINRLSVPVGPGTTPRYSFKNARYQDLYTNSIADATEAAMDPEFGDVDEGSD
jgi:hypothetical protein